MTKPRAVALSTSLLLGCLSLPPLAAALDASSTDPVAIMRAALNPVANDRALVRMKMTIREGSSSRERLLASRTLRFDAGRKSLVMIEQPADIRGTGFLTIDHNARGKPDDQWLYLPALHRVTRVPATGKSDRFVGSDFTLADLSPKDAEDYTHKLIEPSAKAGDEDCWLIESVPVDAKLKQETGYAKSQSWVSKRMQIPVQVKLWTHDNKQIKYFKASELKQIDGSWIAHRMQMRTLQNDALVSETVIELLSIKMNAPEVTDADFTQQRLERGL